jgi:hypothetical protein
MRLPLRVSDWRGLEGDGWSFSSDIVDDTSSGPFPYWTRLQIPTIAECQPLFSVHFDIAIVSCIYLRFQPEDVGMEQSVCCRLPRDEAPVPVELRREAPSKLIPSSGSASGDS